jgi:hypothetical protein
LENKHKDILNLLAAGKIDDTITSVLKTVAAEVAKSFS